MKPESIDIQIPVPWAREPARIRAQGLKAVLVAAAIAVFLIAVLRFG